MKYFVILFALISNFTFAQQIDYNTKKGFIANGYDVVSYFNNEAKEGSKKYTTTYNAVKYKFSSQENLDIFKANPKEFVPQYGGYCAYAIAVKSKKASINPKTYLINDGKLYLFYNSWGTNTLELWEKENMKGLQKKADKNWELIKF